MIERPKRASGELDRDRLWIHVPHFGDDADFGASASEFARTIYTTLPPDIILLIGKAAGEIYSGWRERASTMAAARTRGREWCWVVRDQLIASPFAEIDRGSRR